MLLYLPFLLALTLPISAQEKPSTERTRSDPTMNAADQKFLAEAAQGGAVEVALGQLALQKASDPKVKSPPPNGLVVIRR